MWPSPFGRRTHEKTPDPPRGPELNDVLNQLAAIQVISPVEEQMRALDQLARKISVADFLSGREKLAVLHRIAVLKKAITPKEPREKKSEERKSGVQNDAKLLKEFEKKSADGA